MLAKVGRTEEACMLITFRTQAAGYSDFKGKGAPHAVLQLLNGEGTKGNWEHITSFGISMAGGKGGRKSGMVFFNTRFAKEHGFDVSWMGRPVPTGSQ